MPTQCSGAPQKQLGKVRPNIVLVFIDDMGWGDFSCFGNTDASTPNIDRLAEEGIRFEQFYVNSPICSPSRCAITTGQYPQRHRITSFLNGRKSNKKRGVAQWLSTDAPTLPRILKEHGYATGHFGKWHLGGQRDVTEAPPITRYGFDESLTNFEGIGPKLLPLTMRPGDEKPGRIWDRAEMLGGPVVWMKRSEITAGFANAAQAFIRRATRAKKPFYINLWPDDVHSPYWPPVEDWGDGSNRRLYLSVLEAMDQQFGRLFNQIQETPALRNNTLILICSDNGPAPDAGSAGPFRGHKTQLYEGGVRSPLVVWGPGFIDSSAVGSSNKESVFSAMDLVPSLLRLVGVDDIDSVNFDGEPLPDTLIGKSKESRTSPIFFRRPPDRDAFYGIEDLPDLAVRSGKWKLLCEYDGSNTELYDLSADAGETKNVASERSSEIEALRSDLLNWHRSMPADNGPQLIGSR
ncbi:MAG: sulfatase-like hydrolase/transferase [Planctomycetota bacterium]